MNIAFFGSSLVSAYWNGAATYYRGIVRALHERGHRVTFYEPDAYDRQQHRDIADPDWAASSSTPPRATDAVRRCLDEAARRRPGRQGERRRRLRRAARSARAGAADAPATLVAFWDVDAPATLDRVHADPDDPFRALIPRYDLVLTYGGGEPVVRRLRALGARRCVPIYNALDPSTHHPVPPDPRFDADLGFLGNRLPDREARVEEFFLKPAAAAARTSGSCSAATAGTTSRCRPTSATSATSTRATTTRSTARRGRC